MVATDPHAGASVASAVRRLAIAASLAWLSACTHPSALEIASASPGPEPAAAVEPDHRFTPPSCARTIDDPPTLVPYLSGGKWGLAELDGAPVVPATYAELRYSHGLAEVRGPDGLWGVIVSDGTEVLAPEFAYVSLLARQDGIQLVAARDRQHAQLFDACGQLLLPGTYHIIWPRGSRTIVERDDAWALLDQWGEPILDWGPRLHWAFDDPSLVLRARGSSSISGYDVVHDDGRVWAPSPGTFEFHRVIWPEQPALLTIEDQDQDSARACLYDLEGEPLVACGEYLELWPVSDTPPLMWAKAETGWGMIEVREGQAARVHVPLRHDELGADGLLTRTRLNILVDGHGEAVVLDAGPLPPDCRGLSSWRRVQTYRRGEQLFEYLDADGLVLERAWSGPGRGRWIRDERGIHDICTGERVASDDYGSMCGDTHLLTAVDTDDEQPYGSAGFDILDLEHGTLAHLDVTKARCFRGQVLGGIGGSRGLFDVDGRELLPIAFHDISIGFHEQPSILQLKYFGTTLYARTDGYRYYDELPTPGEFPETVERVLSRRELRRRDRATLQRMVDELHARYEDLYLHDFYPCYSLPCNHGIQPRRTKDHRDEFGPIETANLETLEALLGLAKGAM